MSFEDINLQINEILNGKRDLPQFNQPEHAGVCSAGSLLIGALIVCNLTRESLSAGGNASGSEGKTSNWKIDAVQENAVNYTSDRLHLEDMHPANVFVEPLTGHPICIDCIVKFRR